MVICSHSNNQWSADYVYFPEELQLNSQINSLQKLLKTTQDITEIEDIESQIKSLEDIKTEKMIEFNDCVLAMTSIIMELFKTMGNPNK